MTWHGMARHGCNVGNPTMGRPLSIPHPQATSLNNLATISNYIMLNPPSAEGFSLDLSSMLSKGSATYFRTQITNIEKQLVYSTVSEPLHGPEASRVNQQLTDVFRRKMPLFKNGLAEICPFPEPLLRTTWGQ